MHRKFLELVYTFPFSKMPWLDNSQKFVCNTTQNLPLRRILHIENQYAIILATKPYRKNFWKFDIFATDEVVVIQYLKKNPLFIQYLFPFLSKQLTPGNLTILWSRPFLFCRCSPFHYGSIKCSERLKCSSNLLTCAPQPCSRLGGLFTLNLPSVGSCPTSSPHSTGLWNISTPIHCS